jgi:hypothetical protein
MELSDCRARNLHESPFLLAHYAGLFLILKILFAGELDCNFFHVLIMGHWKFRLH